MKLSVVACAFLLLTFQYSETKAQTSTQCEWEMSNACVCKYKDPNTGEYMTVDISHYFNYPINPKPDSDKYTYMFAPCVEVQCEESTVSGVACQYVKAWTQSVSLGRIEKSNTWFINQPSVSQFQFTIHYNGGDPVIGLQKTWKSLGDWFNLMAKALVEEEVGDKMGEFYQDLWHDSINGL